MENSIRFGENFLEMDFDVNWDLVSNLFVLLKNITGILLKQSKRSELISVSVAEFAENAVKFSKPDENNEMHSIRFRLHVLREEGKAKLSVTNHSDEAHIQQLRQEIDFIHNHTTEEIRLDFFQRAMQQDQMDKIPFGIRRLVMDMDVKLNLKVEGHFVTVFAEYVY